MRKKRLRGFTIYQETWSEHHKKKKAIELFGLIDNDKAEALRKVNNPRGETKLHYDVVNNITSNYPNVLIIPGLGENQLTHSGRLDSKAKGHRKRSA